MNDKRIIWISPSRWSTMLQCNRLGFLGYHHAGGLKRRGQGPLYFAIGQAVHGGAERLWRERSLAEAMEAVPSYFPPTEAIENELDSIYRQEGIDISQALLYVWNNLRLPTLLAEYEPVMLETPMEIDLYEDDNRIIRLYCILDGLLQRREDGMLTAWELKTTKQVQYNWLQSWEYNAQLALETHAAITAAHNAGIDQPVTGVMIEALIKGRQGQADVSGLRKHSNSLVWPYVGPSDPLTGDAPLQVYRKGWPRLLASLHHPRGLMGWLNERSEAELAEYTRTLDPIRQPDELRESFLAQIVGRLLMEDDFLVNVLQHLEPGSPEYWAAVDRQWPQNTRACHFPTSCPMLPLCFDPIVREDPLGSRLYEHRPTIEERQAAEAEEE